LAAHDDDGAHDGLLHSVVVDVADQLHVDFDEVGLKIGKQAEAGIAGAEIVDRRGESEPPVLG